MRPEFRVCPSRKPVGGALRRSGCSGRMRTRLRLPTGSNLDCPPPVSSAGVISLLRSPATILHAGASGERARLPLPGWRRGAGGELGGKGRHFRLGPRVSPERRHLLRLLSLLPAETPAPVSDWVCGPGTRVPRGRGASPCPAAVSRTQPLQNVSASLPGPRQGIPNH